MSAIEQFPILQTEDECTINNLRATVQEQAAEIASLYEMNLAQAKTIAEQAAEIALLKQVEANLCELHNVALGEIESLRKQAAIEQALRGMSDYAVKLSAEQHKVKVLRDALESLHWMDKNSAVRLALATVKGEK